jgi:hypothetical protein
LRLVDVELNTGTKLNAMEVASAELISGSKLVGGSARRAQRQRVDVGGAKLADNIGLSVWKRAQSLPAVHRERVGYV